ncbi:MAG: hypothetical protein Q7R68_03790 [Nitrospirales bacterium]|nr:hypothetical protein [Nitrospirales bacterium]
MSPSHFSALTVIACLALNLAACGESFEEKQKRENTAREEQQKRVEVQRAQVIAELRTTFHADDVWKNGTVGWTVQLQDRLIRQDGKPIIGTGYLRDVQREGDRFRIYVSLGFMAEPSVEFVLEGCQPKAKSEDTNPLKIRYGNTTWYAFVARVQHVRRSDMPVISVDEGSIAIDHRPQWIAHGECLALRELSQK